LRNSNWLAISYSYSRLQTHAALLLIVSTNDIDTVIVTIIMNGNNIYENKYNYNLNQFRLCLTWV